MAAKRQQPTPAATVAAAAAVAVVVVIAISVGDVFCAVRHVRSTAPEGEVESQRESVRVREPERGQCTIMTHAANWMHIFKQLLLQQHVAWQQQQQLQLKYIFWSSEIVYVEFLSANSCWKHTHIVQHRFLSACSNCCCWLERVVVVDLPGRLLAHAWLNVSLLLPQQINFCQLSSSNGKQQQHVAAGTPQSAVDQKLQTTLYPLATATATATAKANANANEMCVCALSMQLQHCHVFQRLQLCSALVAPPLLLLQTRKLQVSASRSNASAFHFYCPCKIYINWRPLGGVVVSMIS